MNEKIKNNFNLVERLVPLRPEHEAIRKELFVELHAMVARDSAASSTSDGVVHSVAIASRYGQLLALLQEVLVKKDKCKLNNRIN